MITLNCKQCNKEFQNYASNHRKFCSKKCWVDSYGSLPNCTKCKKQLTRRNRQFCFSCSLEKFKLGGIKSRFSHGNTPYGENLKKAFSLSQKKRFANSSAWNKGKNLIIKNCLVCKKEFKTNLSRVSDGKGKFCSRPCSNKLAKSRWDDPAMNLREKKRQSRIKQVIPNKETTIELNLQKLLRDNGIKFETHYPILGQPDIFVKPNICIFADGCYWHKCTECGHEESIRKEREKDKQVTRTLQSQGYTVIRLWEHEINKNLNNCFNKIIQQHAIQPRS